MLEQVRTGLLGGEPDLRKVGLDPNFWYPMLVAKDLKKGKAIPVSFAGEPIVLVRTQSNKIYALENRCAHRQMPLSFGIVTGERLKCCYHGWSYDEFGRPAVPYLPGGAPPPRGVRVYPCRTAYGLIFVFPGNAALTDRVPLPSLTSFHSNDYVTTCFSRKIACHYSFIHENLMDMNHQFLHRRWMGKFQPKLLAFRKGPGFVEVDYTFDSLEGIFGRLQHMAAMYGRPGKEPRAEASGHRAEYDGDVMTVATHYPYQSLTLHRPKLDGPLLQLWVAYVSADREERMNRPCGVLLIRKPAIRLLAYPMRTFFQYFVDAIFEEDRFALEAEQRAHDMQGADWNQEILPFILELRALLMSAGITASTRVDLSAAS
jgi:phenylpropionate dioxygenase-like ring-hydroxylating dioxygenase large terminal subunit